MPFTSFHPRLHGFPFTNDFTNTVGVGPVSITTKGRCGGMVFTALDCYFAQSPAPNDKEAVGDHLFNRQLDSMVAMGQKFIDKFAQQIAPHIDAPIVGHVGPGLSLEELFVSGLDYADGVVNTINQGRPIPLGLITLDFDPADNHQILAIGYDANSPRDRRVIYTYDPNKPLEISSLTADPVGHRFNDSNGKSWRTIFNFPDFSPKPPPRPAGKAWVELDNNPMTAGLAADGHHLYQIHSNGLIWKFEGFGNWLKIDQNPASKKIVASGGNLYQLHSTGAIFKYTGVPITGWQCLDQNPATVDIIADGNHLYQLHGNGRIWRYTGTPLTGWQELDKNPATKAIVASGGNLYQLHANGMIWRFTGTPHSGWQLLDQNPATVQIVADGNNLYQRHNDGRIWKYTGTPMTGWQQLDANPATRKIAAAAGNLYQIHANGMIWQYAGSPHWPQLDANPASRDIVATGNYLFQVHDSGRIWRR